MPSGMFQRTARLAAAAASLCIALAACGSSSATRITVTPASGLADRARTIVLSGLSPEQMVTINARSIGPTGVLSASATFRASRRGGVDLADSAPTSGSYRGVSPMGLFWSQHLAGSQRRAAGPQSPSWYSTRTELTASAGGRRLASAEMTQTLMGAGVRLHVERLAAAGFVGLYFTPAPGHARGPGVVVWGGSEGGFGVSPQWAALLASHGTPALALAYFGEPGLPRNLQRIPLEYFVRAIRWLRAQPGVDPHRLWILSASRGSEAELLVASHWPGLVHGLVGVSPSAYVYSGLGCLRSSCPSWTLDGRPLASARALLRASTFNADGSISEVSAFSAGLADRSADRAARIPIGGFRGPVCLLSGGDDQLWPSDHYVDTIMAELRNDPAVHRHLNYPGAGHLVFDIPYVPTSTESTVNDYLIALGGTKATYEEAHVNDWPFVLRFIASR